MGFLKEFFSLNLLEYENIGFYFPIGLFLTILCISACFLVFFVTLYKRQTGALCRRLLRADARDEQSAKTLSEIKLSGLFLIKGALSRGGGQLAYVIKRAGEEKPSYEEYIESLKKNGNKSAKIDFETARFYIPEERIDTAKRILSGGEQSYLLAALISVIFVGLLLLSAAYLPDILSSINSSL